jgi:hypothetical protein
MTAFNSGTFWNVTTFSLNKSSLLGPYSINFLAVPVRFFFYMISSKVALFVVFVILVLASGLLELL